MWRWAPLLAGRAEIELVVTLTVLLSVLLQGATVAPLSDAYARQVEGMAAAMQYRIVNRLGG